MSKFFTQMMYSIEQTVKNFADEFKIYICINYCISCIKAQEFISFPVFLTRPLNKGYAFIQCQAFIFNGPADTWHLIEITAWQAWSFLTT